MSQAADINLDLVFDVRCRVSNAISRDELKEYGDDPLRYARFLVQEEGLCGIIDDDFDISAAWTLPAK